MIRANSTNDMIDGQTLTPAMARVFERLHYPLGVTLMCVQ
jgi:hypothetical protein